ncbi:MAG: hypothetical protein M1828_004542 [Chrysothrix sp. TS-e1954]|nr:MAG: hypothetical protein M1828_004542 [Chrysothrix sp. TS-e1954]
MAEDPSSSPRAGDHDSQEQCAEASEASSKPKKKRRPVTPPQEEKPKLTKSRNGCLTCKWKRLKCDEVKPECGQCRAKSLICGGYSKNFKWKAFEDQAFGARKIATDRRKPSFLSASRKARPLPSFQSSCKAGLSSTPFGSHDSKFRAIRPAISNEASEDVTPHTSISGSSSEEHSRSCSRRPHRNSEQQLQPPDASSAMPDDFDWLALDSALLLNDFPLRDEDTGSAQVGDTWTAQDIAPDCSPSEERLPDSNSARGLDACRNPMSNPEPGDQNLVARSSGCDIFKSAENVMLKPHTELYSQMNVQPQVFLGSPDMVASCFHRNTCGIMSIQNDSTNPWRVHIWPLVHYQPVVYHAVASMVCFHSAKIVPKLLEHANFHRSVCIKMLIDVWKQLPISIALATCLALAFAESWDTEPSTGIDHIKGARQAIEEASLAEALQRQPTQERARLEFLCKTWIYADVISRLTSAEDDHSAFFEQVTANVAQPYAPGVEIDPLMGCASTLFPIIGRVANLVRKVCRNRRSTPATIAEGVKLKSELEHWRVPELLRRPKDPDLDVSHAVFTARAYVNATLLYLHQAVPQIPFPGTNTWNLAEETLNNLMLVPITSSMVIVQIYPLLTAGCEAISPEDRRTVLERWESMSQRMSIGNVDRCIDVVREVWRRRDEWKYAIACSMFSLDTMLNPEQKADPCRPDGTHFAPGGDSRSLNAARASSLNEAQICDDIDYNHTVHGDLHWVRVMKDLGWEVLLG